MRLFKEIDKKATKENADEVLNLYRRYANMSGKEYTPKVTASYSLEPRGNGGPVSRSTEITVTNRVAAWNELEAIMEAINQISDSFARQVVIKKYCERPILPDKAIYPDLGYSESEFYRLWERGVVEFAECYRGGELLVFRKSILGRDLQESC